MTDLEQDYQIAEAALEEAFTKLREDYCALCEHADKLKAILGNHGIEYPDFCGW